jgi:hypothetical protein
MDDFATFLTGVYKDQLGRAPDPGGLQYYLAELQAGRKTQDQIRAELNKSLEGQNFDTQLLTSEYRTEFGRDPEQEGYQYWMSRLQNDPTLTAATLENYIRGGAAGADLTAMGAPDKFLEIMTSSLQADPWAGRRATQDIYGVGDDAINVSMVGDMRAQFVNPVTQQAGISVYDPLTGSFKYQLGVDTLDPVRVKNAIDIAKRSGSLSAAQAEAMFSSVSNATNIDAMRRALAAPQATVVLDNLYGMQIGEDANAMAARDEAEARQAVLNQFNYAPAYDNFGAALQQADLTNPFQAQNYYAPTMATPASVVTPQNFGQKQAETLNMSFAGSNFVPSYVTPGFYSERGFEPQFVGFGPEGPTFRSGVAGYGFGQPTGFQFGVPQVQSQFTPFLAGKFDPGIINPDGTWRPTPNAAQKAVDDAAAAADLEVTARQPG